MGMMVNSQGLKIMRIICIEIVFYFISEDLKLLIFYLLFFIFILFLISLFPFQICLLTISSVLIILGYVTFLDYVTTIIFTLHINTYEPQLLFPWKRRPECFFVALENKTHPHSY